MAKPKKNKTTGAVRGSRKRRGKGEAFTEAKANEVEVRKLGGDNAPELKLPSEEDFNYHLKSIKGYREKKDTAVANLRNANKAAEKTCKGLSGIVGELLGLERADNPHDFQRKLELLGYGLKVTNSPIQLTVFDTLLGDVTAQAYARGKADGANGKSASNPYPEGSDLASEYTRGWQHGTVGNLGLTEEQSDAAMAENGNANGKPGDPWPDDAQASGDDIPGFLKRDTIPAGATH